MQEGLKRVISHWFISSFSNISIPLAPTSNIAAFGTNKVDLLQNESAIIKKEDELEKKY